jgi:hypothetical protein
MIISSVGHFLSGELLRASGTLLTGLGFVAMTFIRPQGVRMSWTDEAQAIVAFLGPSAVVLVLVILDLVPPLTLFVSVGASILLFPIVAMLQVRRRNRLENLHTPPS